MGAERLVQRLEPTTSAPVGQSNPARNGKAALRNAQSWVKRVMGGR